jgi:hypothetical protein
MYYVSPVINEIQINNLSHTQGSGVVPLNPDCNATGCENTFIGEFCLGVGQEGLNYDVHYFIPNLTCESLGETPCTVKVSGDVLTCSVESTCTDTNSCDNQAGSIIRCSGVLPNLDGCSGLEATVECTSETDSDGCASAT